MGLYGVILKFIGLIFFILQNFYIKAQPFTCKDCKTPLDITLAISGNFGELRSNAFHAGIDFKTSAMVGQNVYAVEDGYVSRIKVDLNGFGKALYIDHPNGTTSVYGHLEVLGEDIDKYCKREQYKLKQFGVDINLKPNEIVVKKGDVIAFAGNRGGSSGPHMHFEVRETKTQFTLNVFKVTNLTIPDTAPPIIEKIWLYPIRGKINNSIAPVIYNTTSTHGVTWLNSNAPINAAGEIGIGVQTYDLSSNSLNKIGIFSIKLWVDDELIFEQVFDKLSFDEMRYVNSLIDYESYIKNGTRINKLFLQPNNHLSSYRNVKDLGILNFQDTATKHVKIKITDDFSNINECSFDIKGTLKGKELVNTTSKSTKAGILMHYNKPDTFFTDKVKLYLPKDALYDDLWFEYSKHPGPAGYYSEIHQIHNPYTALHRLGTLSIKPKGLPSSLYKKAILVSLDPNGKIIWNGGGFKDGFVTGNIRSFGNYTITIDTVPPQIVPLFTNRKENDFTNWSEIAFTAKDNLTSFVSYRGLIDGQWVLFEYDPKQDLVYYKFDAEHMKFGQNHKLELYVYDDKGNKAEYKLNFYK
jgi:murein DD-endopeptidase MepM/ murein hydrolase activator NlpD